MAIRLPFTVSQVVTLARAQVGICESPAGSNRQKFSADLGRGPEPWCGDFIAWLFLKLGWDMRPTIPGFAWTPTMAAHMLSACGWQAVNARDARAGDVLFFNFDGGPTIQHVELGVGSLTGGLLPTVGGNTTRQGETRDQSNGGIVAARMRQPGQVVAVRRPLYAVPVPSSTPAPTPAPVHRPPITLGPVLRRGSTGGAVYALQVGLLRAFPAYAGRIRRPGGGPNRTYGPNTEAVVREFQGRVGLARTGVVNAETWARLARFGVRSH